MKRLAAAYLLVIVLVATLSSCSVVRVETDRHTPRGERITQDELERFVRRPETRGRWWSTRRATPDSAMVARSALNIESYMRSRGYYDARIDARMSAGGRRVVYAVTQGEPHRIASVEHRFRDESLRETLEPQLTNNSLINAGDIFDIGMLNAERARIADYLKMRGYYHFTVNNITYTADTTRSGRTVDLVMIVGQHLVGYNEFGEPQWENNRAYRIGEIFLNPAHDPVASTRRDEQHDTLNYRGLGIIGRPHVRERVLRRAVTLNPGDIYDAREVQQTCVEIMRLGYFRSAAILFEEMADDRLRCVINCIPSLRQSYKFDIEGSVSSNFFAIGATAGYRNRNLFRGAELFDISLTGRHEFMRTTGRTGSYEVGGNVSVTWPRFLLPIPSAWQRGMHDRLTRLEMSLDYQDRPIFKRTLSGVRLAYSWNNSRNGTFIVRPLDIHLINVRDIDREFLASLRNPYLQKSYESQLAAGISGVYLYGRPDAATFRLSAETAGNLLSAFARLTSATSHWDEVIGGAYYNAFGLRFSQYARLEASLSNRIATGTETALAWRVLAGGAVSYGNSTPMPYDRFFYAGGSNSMRGWIARRLGPGTQPHDKNRYPSQIGNLRLEANAEFRFPVWNFVQSAVFLDAGNIWFAGKRNYDDPELNHDAVFHLHTFARQLALNTGVGVRLDFNRFIFRVDWGIRLHDPGQPAGARWIRSFRTENTALNFGVGYPF